MTTPTAYTDSSLAAYMLATLRATATTLGWTSTAHAGYTQAIHETLRAYPITTVPSATDMQRLETLARREIWRQAMAETANRMDAASGEERASLSQVWTHIKAMFDQAVKDVAALPVDLSGTPSGGIRRQSSVHQNQVVW